MRNTLIFSLLLLSNLFYCQILVPPNFFGINHWMPVYYDNYVGTPLNGPVENTNVQQMVLDGGITFYRIGGNGYDTYGDAYLGQLTTTNDYIRAIEAIKAINPAAKFLIQIPFKSGNFGFTANQAQALVAALDTKYGTAISDKFYYAIGNEWDLYKDNATPPNKLFSSAQIATNIKAFAIEMKGQNPNIKIVGPSLSGYWATDKNGLNIMNDLIGSGNSNDITVAIPFNTTYPLINGKYYIDVVDIHSYAQGNNGNMSGLNSQATFNTWRANAVGFPYTSPGFLDVLSTASYGLIGKLNTANSSRAAGSKLTFAVTELNITYSNTALPITNQNDPLQNTSVSIQSRSFFAGQYWLNMYSTILKNGNNMADFVMPWSIHESGGNGSSQVYVVKPICTFKPK